MGLIFLILAGGVLGWIAAIATDTEQDDSLRLNVPVGIAGALAGGLIVNPLLGGGSLLSGHYRPTALMVSVLVSVGLLFIVNVWRLAHIR